MAIPSFREFVEEMQNLTEDEINERRLGEPSRVAGVNEPKNNKRKDHKELAKMWDKFLRDVEKMGYVIPRRHNNDSITFHHTDFSPNDVGGRFTLDLPSKLVKKINI